MKLNKLLFSIILSGITASLTCAGISAQEENIQDQYDIVIIGAGAAGMNAAIHACDEGDANIVILESLPYAGGGSSKAYGGIYSSSVSYETDPSADGDNDTTIDELFEAGLEASAGADEKIQRFYAEHAHETLEWLNDLGYRWGTVHYGNLYRPSDGSGVGDQLTKVLLEQIKARDIEIRYNTTATRILTGEDGTITGVHAENSQDGSYDIATGCIILATGGYANNQEMLRQYNPEFAAAYVNNSPGSNGMGILMAQQLGADVVNMENLYLFETVEPDNIQHSVPYDLIYRGTIFVNKEGRRFTNECNEDLTQIAIDTLAQTDAAIYAVFNDRIYQDFLAEKDNLDLYDTMYAEGLAKTKNLVCADSIDELADMIGIDSQVLSETIENLADSEIENEYLSDALDSWKSGPYYAIKETAAIGNTLGGLVVDTDAHVYDTEGNIIEGLYAAGEVAGNTMVSDFYYGLTDAVLMGQQAGKSGVDYVKATSGITEHQEITDDSQTEEVVVEGHFTDGIYEGTGSGLNGEIKVRVTVENGSITEINVLEANETETLLAGVIDTVIPAIIRNQTTQVDTVSGATFASQGVIEAVSDALEN